MKRVLILSLIVMLLLVQFASAKSFLYITKNNTHAWCSQLPQEDKEFCSRLEALGYERKTLNELMVRDKATKFESWIKEADFIFLGSISESLTNTTNPERTSFCNNILSAGKPIFAAFENTVLDNGKQLKGCIFTDKLFAFQYSNNMCPEALFEVNSTSYPANFIQSEVINPYKKYYSTAILSSKKGETLLNLECTANGKPDFYPAVQIKDKNMFWGLSKPSEFTEQTWKIFDRAILYITDNYMLESDIFTLPEYPTQNQDFKVVAKITDKMVSVKNISINLEIADNPVAWSYNNKTNCHEAQTHLKETSILSAVLADEKGLKENKIQKQITIGNISVEILNQNYHPNEKFKIGAKLVEPKAAELKYKILDSSYKLIEEGDLELENNEYTALTSLSEIGDAILEINALNSTLGQTGGNYKLISSTPALIKDIDFKIIPNELVWITKSDNEKSQAFTIQSINLSINNIRINITDNLKNISKLDTASTKQNLNSGESTAFSINIDLSDAEQKDYEGKILIESDDFYFEIPVIVSYHDVSGSWLKIIPDTWFATTNKEKEITKTFSLKNTGIYHLGEIQISIPDNLKDYISVKESPSYILTSQEKNLTLSFSSGTEGSYDGDIFISSTHGATKLLIGIEALGDLSSTLSDYQAKLDTIEEKIASTTWVDTSYLSDDIDVIKTLLERAKREISGKEFELAQSDLEAAAKKLDYLEIEVSRFPQQPDYGWTIYLIIIIVIGIIIFILFKNKDKLKGLFKRKEKEYRTYGEEDKYRTEYY